MDKMQITLTKQGKSHIQFIQLEIRENILVINRGKNCRIGATSTKKYGSTEKAIIEFEDLIKECKHLGFIVEGDNNSIHEKIIFDKASWHLNDTFPHELPKYQAYVHTGFYIGWLINNQLVSEEIKNECQEAIHRFKNGEITCVEFYKNQLDGVFTSEDVNSLGLAFTQDYFDFSTGKYLDDYEKTLAPDQSTLFHVKDTNDNFNAISFVILKRYNEWKSKTEMTTFQFK